MKRRTKRALAKLTISKMVRELRIKLVRCDSQIFSSLPQYRTKSKSPSPPSNAPMNEEFVQPEEVQLFSSQEPSDLTEDSDVSHEKREFSGESDNSSNTAVAEKSHDFHFIVVPPVCHQVYKNFTGENSAEGSNPCRDQSGCQSLSSFPEVSLGGKISFNEEEQHLQSLHPLGSHGISDPIVRTSKRSREDEVFSANKRLKLPTTDVETYTYDSGQVEGCSEEYLENIDEEFAKLIEGYGVDDYSDSEGSDYEEDTEYSSSEDSGNESEDRESEKELEIYIENFKKKKESQKPFHSIDTSVTATVSRPATQDDYAMSTENIRCDNDSVSLPDLSAVSFFGNCQSSVDQANTGPVGINQVPQPLMSSSRLEKDTSIILDRVQQSIEAFNDCQPCDHQAVVLQYQENICIRKVPKVLKDDGKTRIRKRLTHFCKFCKKDCSNLKLHMIRTHRNEQEVVNMVNKCESSEGKRDPMKTLLHAGDLMYNKALVTGIGIEDFFTTNPGFRVARMPEKEDSSIDDYIPCPMCLAMFKEKDFRAHWRECSTLNCSRHRNSIQTGRKMFMHCHPLASQQLKTRILCRMRSDHVFRAIRHDELIIHFGNRLCLHLRNEKDIKNIKTQMRRLGRLKIMLKVKKISDVLQSGMSEKIVAAIEKMAADPCDLKKMKYPTVAQNMATLVKTIAKTFSFQCLKKGENERSTAASKFVEVFENDYLHLLSHHARDAHREAHAHKSGDVPLPQDVKNFYLFLCRLRKKNMDILKKNFDIAAYQELLEVTLLSLIVYSRRRPGDVQYIQLEEWTHLRRTDEKNSRAFHTLPSHLQEVAKQMSMLYTRGKLGKIVKVLVPPDVKDCIDMLKNCRLDAGVHPDNSYLFGLPASAKKKVDYPKACYLMKTYARDSGCQQPHLLSATHLRKQLATECMLLNLDDAGTADLANFMSHHVDIHRRVYQQDVLAREIPIVLNFLSTALDIGDDIGDLNMNNLAVGDASLPNVNTYNESLDRNNQNTSSLGDKDYTVSMEQLNNDSSEQGSVPEDISIPKTPPKRALKISKKRWTTEEKEIALRCFKLYMNREKNTVSNMEISAMLARNPALFQGRNHEAIRTWLYGQRRKSKV